MRGERRSPPFFHKICIGLLFRSPRLALRKEGGRSLSSVRKAGFDLLIRQAYMSQGQRAWASVTV